MSEMQLSEQDIAELKEEFAEFYASENYEEAYIRAMVLFDVGYREKQFLYDFATTAFHIRVFTIFLEKMRNLMTDKESSPPIRIASQKIARRMHHVFCDKAGVPTWNFHLPLDIN